ncbi:AAA family ATPase [Kineococcus endophyticus]|uniref:AAA family ATPase n=1 Tax=Kineococcus endophyticus TaxID=1181883 RepID=A0ABV3PDX7_9ACTN
MHTIAIANHKGGVGKTTTAVNLAAGLARRGHRTLLVDVDAQAHATFWFVDDPDDIEADLQDVVTGRVAFREAVRTTRIEGLDLLPATLALAQLEVQLVSMTRREDRIARALEPGRDAYEFVVLDLAPSLSLVSLAALVAADSIVAPVSATKLAVSGLGAFLGWTDDFRLEGVITAPLLGVLVTMVDYRTRVTREVLEALDGSGLPLFATNVPRRVAAEDQVGERLVTGDAGSSGDLSAAYDAFIEEVLTRTTTTCSSSTAGAGEQV